METIKLLDLCCKAGGCSVGYSQAASDLGVKIEITGVDIERQRNYPFHFVQGDAVEYLKKHGHLFTHIHASPPCQQFSTITAPHRKLGKEYPDIVQPIRHLIESNGWLGVLENVPGSAVRPDIVLRGDVFGLRVIRRRFFETVNWFSMRPVLPKLIGSVKERDYVTVVGNYSWNQSTTQKNGAPAWATGTIKQTWIREMQVPWMTEAAEITNAIPPPIPGT